MAANDGNWFTQPTTQPTTQQPVQDVKKGDANDGATARQSQQEAMFKLMADREASSSSRSITGLSLLFQSVDTHGVLKCDVYHGEKEKVHGLEEGFLQQP